MNRHPAARPAFAGFTLVETMVALVIGLLATFIVMQVFALSEGQKRTIMGGADAQSDAAVVLYLIERDLRQAGYGLTPNPEDFNPPYVVPTTGVAQLASGVLAQCVTVTAYKSDRATTPAFVYAGSTFAPVVINPAGYSAGDAGTDVVLVNYGASNGMIGKGVVLNAETSTTQSGGDVPDFRVNPDKGFAAGFMNGDLVLAVPAAGDGCAIAEITGLPDAGDPGCTDFNPPTTIIRHNAVAYANFYAGCGAPPTPAKWNQAGVDLGFGVGSKLYNLGPVGGFVSRVYAVRKGNLTVCDLTLNDCTAAVADPPDPAVWTPVASGVVGLKAQYGIDADFDGVIDTNGWNTTTPVGAARAGVAAVRLVVAVRSGQFEKEDVTAAAPVWHQDAASTSNVTFDLTGLGSDWSRYRYKTAQSIVPVRNLLWGQQK